MPVTMRAVGEINGSSELAVGGGWGCWGISDALLICRGTAVRLPGLECAMGMNGGVALGSDGGEGAAMD